MLKSLKEDIIRYFSKDLHEILAPCIFIVAVVLTVFVGTLIAKEDKRFSLLEFNCSRLAYNVYMDLRKRHPSNVYEISRAVENVLIPQCESEAEKQITKV